MARVFCRTNGETIELAATDEVLVVFPGIPGRGFTIGQLVSLVGEDRLYAELMGRASLGSESP